MFIDKVRISVKAGAGGTSKFGIDESDLPALKTLVQRRVGDAGAGAGQIDFSEK